MYPLFYVGLINFISSYNVLHNSSSTKTYILICLFKFDFIGIYPIPFQPSTIISYNFKQFLQNPYELDSIFSCILLKRNAIGLSETGAPLALVRRADTLYNSAVSQATKTPCFIHNQLNRIIKNAYSTNN